MSDGNPAFWKKHASRYDRATRRLSSGFAEMAQAVAARTRGAGDVLEIAAGTGMVTEIAAPGAGHYIATDASEEMLEILRARVGTAGHIQVRAADALALSFPDAAFDVVVMANLLHLLPQPLEALAEAWRVLRPGGLLVAPTFAHGQGLRANVVSRLLAGIGFPVQTRFRGDELDQLIGRAGFELREARWFSGLIPIRFVVFGRREKTTERRISLVTCGPQPET
ncbi:MAG: class I SAM-dependent methyltransferase [Deltaproteobacteria bacterium]